MARRVLRPHEKTAPHPALSEPVAVPYNPMASVAALDAAAADSRSANEAAQRAALYRQQLRDGEWTAQRVVRPRAEVAEQYGIDFARSDAAERTRRNAEMLRALQEGGRIEMDAPPMEWDVRRPFAVRTIRNNTGEALRPGQLVRIPPQETEGEREQREERERLRAIRAAARAARAEREQGANDRYRAAINEIRAKTGRAPNLEQMMRERFKAHGLVPDESQE